ncbi:MAG: hypothetical protein WDA28_11315 [Castellaniella sp.]
MWTFSIGRAWGLMMQTLPFIMLRCLVYFGITLAYILATGVGSGIGWGVGGFGDTDFRAAATVWGGFIGLGVAGAAMYFLREYILYIVKAGHIAVMVRLLDGQPMPEGQSQIDYAKRVVGQRFGQASMLFGLDQLIKGVVKAITGLVQGVAGLLPIPGLQNLMSVVRAFLRLAIGLIDEVILAYAIRTESENPWLSARTALVLYGQNGGIMLRNAAWLTLIVYGLSILVFLFCLAPAAALVYMLPGAWSAGGMVFALLFAWAVKAALIEPFAIACLLQAWFKAIEGQSPDPQWEARLDAASTQFKRLRDKAGSWVGGTAAPTDATDPAGPSVPGA